MRRDKITVSLTFQFKPKDIVIHPRNSIGKRSDTFSAGDATNLLSLQGDHSNVKSKRNKKCIAQCVVISGVS